MAARHVDVNERRLRPVYDALDNLNNKKAIQQADKILKKHKDLHCAKVLKSIALLRCGRREESEKLINDVKKVELCDDPTLQAMTICYREMEKHSEISEIYEVAVKKCPKNEELFTHLFMSYVRTSQFKRQQQVAMNLYKTFQKNPYYFWAVMSYVQQTNLANNVSLDPTSQLGLSIDMANVCEDEHTRNNMLLPLAEKLILKFLNDKKIESDAEVHLYLMVLELQNKHESALEVIDGPLGEILSPNVSARKKIRYFMKLEKWSDINILCKNLIETRPNEWSYYQGYLESLTRLSETNYSPSAEDSSVPDYTISMAIDFIEKLKCKQLQNNGSKSRAPFLACLELQKKRCEENSTTTSNESTEDLMNSLVEYFQLFGDKSVCFLDLFKYLDCLDSSKRSEFVKTCRSLWMTSSNGHVTGSIKEMSRAITIEKFSRYIGEQEQLSCDEILAHAKNLMSMHRDGLQYGEDLLHTDIQHSDDFALLAAHLLLECCNISDDPNSSWRVLITLESAIKSSPSNIQFKMLVSRVYCLLGAVGPCISYMESMDLKHILYDTLGLNVSRYAAPLGHFQTAKEFYSLVLKFYGSNKKDTPEYVIASYKYGSFEKIIEIVNFQKKLENSFYYKSILLEQKFLDIVLLANSSSSVDEIFVQEKLPEHLEKSETWLTKLNDNRDLELLSSWNRLDRISSTEARKTSFRHELLWLKLRLITINALAVSATSTGVQKTSNHNNDNSEHTTYRTLTEQLQEIFTEVREIDQNTIKFPVYGPLPTRWKTYLDCSYDELLICMLNAVQVSSQIKHSLDQDDTLQEYVTVMKGNLTRSSTIITDNATSCSKSLTYEDSGKRIFNGRVVESLVLLLEAVSIVLVFLRHIRAAILKSTQFYQKKKKRVLPPLQRELLDTYSAFTESLCSALSGIDNDLLDKQVLHLTEDLTTLDINKLYKLTDSSVLTEIWAKMQDSYTTSVQEISNAYKLKREFLKTLTV